MCTEGMSSEQSTVGAQIVFIFVGILAVEAYHSGAIRTLLIQNGDVVTPYGVNVTTIVNAISAARMTLDGSMTTDDVGKYLCYARLLTVYCAAVIPATKSQACLPFVLCISISGDKSTVCLRLDTVDTVLLAVSHAIRISVLYLAATTSHRPSVFHMVVKC